ncbi:chemotaxis protein CheW [Spirochaeta isovalerica]|uniref:Chemotaxis protein CheW n=1 Tax=Spirochaeta isovalerica TaxID=150 RepID=A0A841RBX3_9SPIO|nr:chemotaxis protein CheW [Spirochaeta isovalerica]MBB6481475.1 purine-binding chemotaxis protein CheW [Spirochaeta isovalerica]
MEAVKQSEDDIFLVDDDDDLQNQNKYLLFNLGNEVFGLKISSIIQIVEMQKVTEVPDMPPYIKGVINQRGKVIPLMDLRLRFGMPEREYDDRNCIIIVSIHDTFIGFIVDTVAEVHDIEDKDIDPSPGFKKSNLKEKYISGLGKIGDDVKILLDVEKIITPDDLEQAGAS